MGKYGRFQLAESTIELRNMNDVSVKEFLAASTNFLIEMTEKLDAQKDTDLMNIRDEMLGKVNRLKYLLTLE